MYYNTYSHAIVLSIMHSNKCNFTVLLHITIWRIFSFLGLIVWSARSVLPENNLHWLPIAARIKFKALMFAYRTTSGSAPLFLNSLLQTYMPSRSLCSASERRIAVPSQRGTKSLSQTFSLTVPIWWNDLPNSIRAAESLPIFKKRLKTHLFHLYLTL